MMKQKKNFSVVSTYILYLFIFYNCSNVIYFLNLIYFLIMFV